MKDTELKIIYSESVKDSFFLYIKLPKNYYDEDKYYPVLYLLDGDISFPMATSIVRYQQYGKHIPDIIIIGVGYGTMLSDNEINYRGRDYNLPEVERNGLKGGGDYFLKFITHELIPFTESNYRINSNERAISGHSLSAQYTIYILFSEPELFQKYIASSPHMVNSLDHLLRKEEELISRLEKLNIKLFISHGLEEPTDLYGKPILKVIERLKSRNYKGLALQNKIFKDGSHFVCPPEAMSYGLKFIYEE
jgi:predicted alpha/beta superfamily hydrolase